MILVDTSVWIDHLRAGDAELVRRLNAGQVLAHAFVLGELALGNLQRRETVLDAMRCLPQAVVARDEEVMQFIDRHRLFGLGIGYIDAHLLAAARLSDAAIWSRDKRLNAVCERLSLAAIIDG